MPAPSIRRLSLSSAAVAKYPARGSGVADLLLEPRLEVGLTRPQGRDDARLERVRLSECESGLQLHADGLEVGAEDLAAQHVQAACERLGVLLEY